MCFSFLKGSNKCEAIVLEMPVDEEVLWNGEAFKEMTKLKMLIIRQARFSRGPMNLPNSLRVLEWDRYPSKTLPLDFHPKKLAHLNLSNSTFVSIQPLKRDCVSVSSTFGYSFFFFCLKYKGN